MIMRKWRASGPQMISNIPFEPAGASTNTPTQPFRVSLSQSESGLQCFHSDQVWAELLLPEPAKIGDSD